MDNTILCNKCDYVFRKSNQKSLAVRTKSARYLTDYRSKNEANAKIPIEMENASLKTIIGLLEGKNKVLEENCKLLKEKNLYFRTMLKHFEIEKSDLGDGDVDTSDKSLDKDSTEDGHNSENEKNTSLKDRISGVLFGIALPKLTTILGKLKEKRHDIKNFIEEQGGGHEGMDCPMKKMDFKNKVAVMKVNLFRVVIVLGSLMVLAGVGYAGYTIWKNRYRHPSYLVPSDEDEEDSGDEIFRAPGTSRTNQNMGKTNSAASFETPGISTDFKSILDTANNK